MLLRYNHTDIMLYRMGFVNLALEELGDYEIEVLKSRALAHRFSKADEQDFSKFLKQNVDKNETKAVVDHQAQMKQSQG